MSSSDPARAPRETKTTLVREDGRLFRKVFVGPFQSFGLAEEFWTYIGKAEVYEEICVEPGCLRVATHQRAEAIGSDGTPIVVLVCRRHGKVPRWSIEPREER